MLRVTWSVEGTPHKTVTSYGNSEQDAYNKLPFVKQQLISYFGFSVSEVDITTSNGKG